MHSIENSERAVSDFVSLCEGKRWKRWQVHRSNVIGRFEHSREEAIRLARSVLSKDPAYDADLIEQLLHFKDPMERYEALDIKMEKNKLDAIIVTSPNLVQEIAGVPASPPGLKTLVIYQRNSKVIVVLEQMEEGGDYLEDLTRGLLGGSIGIEDQVEDSLGIVKHLNLSSVNFWSDELHAWQAELSSLEVPYTVLAAKITAGAIDKTLQWTKETLQDYKVISIENIKEQLNKYYCEIVDSLMVNDQFRMNPNIERIEIKFSLPNCFVLSIESGIRLVEDEECVRALSKVSRTLALNPEAEELYTQLKESVSGRMATNCYTNARGRDIYMAALSPDQSSGYTPLVEQGKYNLGFLIGKGLWEKESFSETSSYMLDSGVNGTIEMSQSTAYGELIYGDMFLAHPHKGLNLTKYHPF